MPDLDDTLKEELNEMASHNRKPDLPHSIPSRLAFYSLKLLGYTPGRSIDYTKRCLGCGYFDGDPNAGADHYGYDCRYTDIPWWDVWRCSLNNLLSRFRRL